MKTLHTLFFITFLSINTAVLFAQTWSPVSTGMSLYHVNVLDTFNSGLYAGGRFSSAGGNAANNIAKWDGTTWSAAGSGLGADVFSLAVYNGKLAAGGQGVANWDDINWSSPGVQVGGYAGVVYALAVYNSDLYLGGDFIEAGNRAYTQYIAKWNGDSCFSMGGTGSNSIVDAFAVYNSELFIGGDFTIAGGINANCIAEWNGTTMSAVGTGMNGSSNICTLTVYNSELYAGGTFTNAGGVSANNIAKWNGTNWSAVGGGMNAVVRSLAVYNGELYAGGDFTTADGNPANRIAKWNGSSWSAVGTGTDSTVLALAVYNSDLYVGGAFALAGGVTANYIAKWNTPLGIQNNFINNSINIYPNPTNGRFLIKSNSNEKCILHIIDINGRVVLNQMLFGSSTIDANNLAQGVYNICLISPEERINKRLVIVK